MRLVRLPANCCWAVVLGESIVSLDSDAGCSRMLFPTRADAVECLARLGLSVTAAGRITVRA